MADASPSHTQAPAVIPDGAPFGRPISAKLARRLAAAADGYRDGREVWFTARYVPENGYNFHISKPIVREDLGKVTLKDDEGLFGPFETPFDPGDQKRTPIEKITLHLAGGGAVTFAAADYDSLFWSTSALDKFAVPFYVEFLGMEAGEQLQQDFQKAEVFAVAHGPNTEYTTRLADTPTDGAKHFLIAM